ncbi:MAG: carboxypeptidase regulatory-like domain-containing protein, partial [Bryobacterales bacterium]|nr:carboxypeptidase regulatory-like domain-containing protein [Bryobacterales bacterium]
MQGYFRLVLVGAVVLGVTLSQTKWEEAGSVTAVYSRGAVRVSIAEQLPRGGEGILRVEVLNPEDAVVGHVHRLVSAKAGITAWQESVALFQPLALDELVWHRLRYRFTYLDGLVGAKEIVSISQVLRQPIVHVVSQSTYASGAPAAVRLVVTEANSGKAVTSGDVQVSLAGRVLYEGKLNGRGTAKAEFVFPAGLAGRHTLRYVVDTDLGRAEHEQPVRLEDKPAILLTTEKPVYQPGQTVHVRALALDRATQKAAVDRRMTFEIEDPRGNKVLRTKTQTDDYGIASAEFLLAEEVNLGAYRLLALMDNDSAEMKLRVDRYVLPRFEVRIELAGNSKRGYRPGERLSGTVRAKYFFGKPVTGADVAVRVVGTGDAGNSVRGVTDGEGAFPFELRLPAVVSSIEASVKDTAGHQQSRTEAVAVTESPISIRAIPEGGTVVPGMKNDVLVVTAYADGSPARTEVRVQARGQERVALTDESGVASITLHDANANLRIEAKDSEGNRASVPVTLPVRAGSEHLLLRAERALYRMGETVAVEMFSTRRAGSVFVDVRKHGQTIAMHDAELANGRAAVRFPTSQAMAGALELHAYLLGHDGRAVGDRRLVFVHPAKELRIRTSLDKSVYKPGDEAHIGFEVTDAQGAGVQAALGLEIVDEAVFALAEKQPGFAKVFFHLGQAWMKAIGPLRMPEAIAGNGQDRAARALFAAVAGIRAEEPVAQFGRGVPRNRYAEFAKRYESRFLTQMDAIALGAGESEMCDRARVAAWVRERDEKDAWGNPVRVDEPAAGTRLFTVRSAGPDGSYFTGDDLVQHRTDRKCVASSQWGHSGFGLVVERNVRLHGRAEIVGLVEDQSGAVIPQAEIRLLEEKGNELRRLASNVDGRFHIANLSPGRYELRIFSPGFRTAARNLALNEQERAVIRAVLEIGSVTQTVEVTAATPMLNTSTSMAVVVVKKKPATPPAQAETHVRQWFPESLYVTPRILTDGQGRANLTVPVADSITTWRMSMLASTRHGALGSGEATLKVFQDFFVELDLPVKLTQGDHVSIPVAVFNYTGAKGNVRLRLEESDWFQLAGDVGEKRIVAPAGGVTGSHFTIEARRIGKFRLKLTAEFESESRRADVLVREIEVAPNGREVSVVFNGSLNGTAEHPVQFPKNTIPDTAKVFVRLYPGPLSQVVEGMDAILRMPYGCFEQTSSATYPNVLALDYMKRTKKLNREVQAKASAFIGTGYQRLLTFEVPGGGFSWFGHAPANKILTAYGLMEFSDMAKVHEVDGRVIERTQRWLAGLQQPDGSWQPDRGFINEGVTDRYNSHVLRITAYVAWALASSGYSGPELDRAREYLSRSSGKQDAYTLAVVANFAVEYGRDRAFASQAIRQLLEMRVEQGEQTYWSAEQTGFYGRGVSAMVETTGLAAQALLRSGEAPPVARKAMRFLTANKDASGTWGTTQATIMALRALLVASDKGAADALGKIRVSVNGAPAGEIQLTAENHDLLHQVVLRGNNPVNRVGLQFEGTGAPAYQISGQYFVPWTDDANQQPLTIKVSYDRARVKEGDVLTAVATVRNHQPRNVHMAMVDLGIPPGFELLAEDLEAYRGKKAGRKSGSLQKIAL